MNNARPPRSQQSQVVRIALAAGALPLAVAGVGAVAVWSWRDDLPSRVATRWGADGANGFSTPASVGWLLLGTGLLVAAAGLALALLARDEPALARAVSGTAAGTSGFATALVVASVERQRGIADSAVTTLPGWMVGSALVAASVCAAVAVWLVPPRSATPSTADAERFRLPISATERVVWTRSVATAGVPTVILVAGIGVTAVVGMATGTWVLVVVAALLAALVALMISIRVTVDRDGLAITGRFGWPRQHTPLREVHRADVAMVRPIRDFGGYGYRIAALGPLRGASGFVLRGGPALVVERVDGRRMVVVVDDAATAAGLLNVLVEQDVSR